MPWPAQAIRQFQAVPPNPRENSDFSGAYNKLLHALFPPESDFTVVPWYPEILTLRSPDDVVSFGIFLGSSPVFLLDVKTPAELTCALWRDWADQQIRELLGDFAAQCPIPTLHAVSAMGTRLCFYRLDTTNVAAEIVPRGILHDPHEMNADSPPEERWDCDVLDANGEERLRAVVEEIKEACKNIANA